MKNPNYKNLLIEWLRDSGVSEVISETRNNYYLQQLQNKINQKNTETNKTQKILNLKQSNSINSTQLPKNRIKHDNLESIKSLEELLTAIKEFKGCDLRKTAKNLDNLKDPLLRSYFENIPSSEGIKKFEEGIFLEEKEEYGDCRTNKDDLYQAHLELFKSSNPVFINVCGKKIWPSKEPLLLKKYI